jgi:hypothetical protein
MRRHLRLPSLLLSLAAVWLLCDRATPQQPGQGGAGTPRLFQLLPSGGQQGTTFELIVSGQDLEQASGLLFSEPGISAEALGPTTPPIATPKQPKGAAAKSQKFRVSIPARARLGMHDVRVVTPLGVSNPRAFVVGDLKEIVEVEPNNNVDQMQRVALNSCVSGAIATPTDVDYFVFAGKKGQRVVVSCLSSSIDSKLPASIELYGPGGANLGSNRNYQGNDAVLDADLPADGDYYIRLSSFTYTLGGADYFYRLTIATAPWIDAVYPPIVEPGTKATLTVYGRNLPGGKLDPTAIVDGRPLEKITTTVDVPEDAKANQRLDFAGYLPPLSSGLDGLEFRLRNEVGTSNGMLLTYAQAPVVLDTGDHAEASKAQLLKLPCEVAGRIAKKGDRDWFSFAAKKGEVYSIEIYGDRLGSPVDMYYQLRTADGKLLKEDDDNPEILSPQLYTQTSDPPRYRFVVPADGTYQLMVASKFAYLQAGPRHQYRLRITPERPDFRVVVMPLPSLSPDATLVRQGGHQVLSVYVWRQDGFNAPITLTGENLPPGVIVRPQTIASTQKQAFLALSAVKGSQTWEGPIRLVASATVHGKELVREVRAATMTWPVQQNNLPAISRLDRALIVALREQGPFSLEPTVDQLAVPVGERIEVTLRVERHADSFKAAVQITALNLPQGANLPPVTAQPGKNTVTITLPSQGFQPGRYAIVFRGLALTPGMDAKNPKMAAAAPAVSSSPVTVTIVPKGVAQVTLSNAQPTVKIGNKVELIVNVQRQFDYGGEFKVQLVLPPGTKGLISDELTIPADKDSGKLVIAAEPDAMVGLRGNLTVRVIAQFDAKLALNHDKRLTVNVVK